MKHRQLAITCAVIVMKTLQTDRYDHPFRFLSKEDHQERSHFLLTGTEKLHNNKFIINNK